MGTHSWFKTSQSSIDKKYIIMKSILFILPFFVIFNSIEAEFRCSIGETACSAGCVVLGHTSGICDDERECWCSERSISLDDFRALLPSRCTLGETFCVGTCNAIGRRTGVCTETQGCECSE